MKELSDRQNKTLKYLYEVYMVSIVLLIVVLFLGSCFGLFFALISTGESASFRCYLSLASLGVLALFVWFAKMGEKGKFTFVIKSIEDKIGNTDNDNTDLVKSNKNSTSIKSEELSAVSGNKINDDDDPHDLSIYNEEHSFKLDLLELQKLAGFEDISALEALEDDSISKQPLTEEELNSDDISTENIDPILEEEGGQESALDIESVKVNSLFERLAAEVSPFVEIDYSLLKNLGTKGEQYFLALEKLRLKDLGLKTKIYPLYVAREKGEHWGFDILSLDEQGEQVCLEIKTTNKGKNHPFKMTKNELKVMSLYPDNYQVIRIYNFNEETEQGEFFRINSNELNEKFRRKTLSYKVKVSPPQTPQTPSE